MNADSLRSLVSDYFAKHAEAYCLDPQTLRVEYVLNWGGFVNYSYRVGDAEHAYHLKLSGSAADRTALRRWMMLAPLLVRYHAPPILGWIDLGVAAGPLFPFVPGSSPALDEDVIAELVAVLRQLNADRELAIALRPARGITARDAYMASFHERFTEDLRGIRETRPPFVGEDVVHWLEAQVSMLSARIASCPAFSEPLTMPVHGDLWLNNVLWEGKGSWHLLDWDDVRIGDPAGDLAALLGPTALDLRPLKLIECVGGSLTPAEYERLLHLGHATLLDWIIDPLSDWIDASAAPEHVETVRAEKERIHKAALARYQELYRGVS
jgi:hypothetical protein